ncbi:hypothetical protein NW752_009114 [Fusarium irregulare]|uniref:Uncharacterized protein n=1 Tax=Fusarium irregulare TaxID=2494466 RepID=A0A9W8U7M7_9HYPO|nr:hypothetical protein NW766_008641 [Fusarium irregulare]KAJ4009940.1 hypothetical protein NW752_009114 [Fusarium irregulare]
MSSGTIFTPIPSGTTPLDADVQKPSQATQSVSLTAYKISSKPHDASQYEPEGWLYQGLKTVAGTSQNGKIVNGVLFNCVYYSAALDNQEIGPQVDISHDVTSKEVPGNAANLEMLKAKSPLSPWSFDIIFTDFGGKASAFTGTMIKEDGSQWDLYGTYYGPVSQEVKVTVIPDTMEVPNFNDGTSLASLQAISPIVTVETPGFDIGADGAQIHGNTIMQNLMMQSLLGTKAESVLGRIEPVTDVEQMEIYQANKEFFFRGGVHMLCDNLKSQTQVPNTIADHIAWKNRIFIAMCSQPTVPPPADGQKRISSSWDPARMYGLDPNNKQADATLLETLQSQYRQATMDCYALGYRKQSDEWSLYEAHAEAWFNYYAYYITTPEALERMAVLSANAPGVSDEKSEGPSSMREIVNKLTILRHAAEKNALKAGFAKPNLDVDGVVRKLEAAHNENMAYSMYINDEMVDEAKALLGQGPNDPALARAFQTQLNKMQDETSAGANDLAIIAVSTFELINNSDSKLGKKIKGWWKNRQTRGVKVENLTVAQANQGLELADLTAVRQPAPPNPDAAAVNLDDQLVPDGPAERAINEAGESLLKKMGKGARALGEFGKRWIGRILRVGVHVAAIAFMFRILEGGLSQCSPGEIGAAVCVMGMAGLTLVGKLAEVLPDITRAVGWTFRESGLFQTSRTWFCQRLQDAFKGPPSWSKVGKALVGDLEKAIRTLGLIGCVFNIYMSAEAMHQTGSGPNDPVAARERIFATVNVALGSVELAAGLGTVMGDILGFEALTAVCGPLGLVVGLLAIGVTLIDTIFFPPDPYQYLKDWMAAEPTQFGSYNPNQTFTGTSSLTVSLPAIQISKVETTGNAEKQNGSATHNGSANQNDGGNGDNPAAKSNPAQVTAPQQVAAQRTTTALQAFSDKVSEFQSGTYAASFPRLYGTVLSTSINIGLTWESANLHFQNSTNDFVTA